MLRGLLLLTIVLSAIAPGALACSPPEPVRFRVEHGTFGDIGWHRVDFRCEGDRLIAETRAEIAVEVLFVEAFRRSVHYIEAWKGDRLLEFFGRTVDDGEERIVRARLAGDRLQISGPAGQSEAPPEAIPSHPWHPVSVERRLLFDIQTGEVVEVETQKLGSEYLKIGGQARLARHFRTTGGKRRELWYGEDGSWLQWRLERQGTVTLRPPPS